MTVLRRQPVMFLAPQEDSPEEGALMAAMMELWLRETGRPEPIGVAPLPDGQIGVTDEHGLRAMVEADTVETLLGYARKGNEQDFRDLAAMSGVPLAQLDELWQGTCARLRSGGAL